MEGDGAEGDAGDGDTAGWASPRLRLRLRLLTNTQT